MESGGAGGVAWQPDRTAGPVLDGGASAQRTPAWCDESRSDDGDDDEEEEAEEEEASSDDGGAPDDDDY